MQPSFVPTRLWTPTLSERPTDGASANDAAWDSLLAQHPRGEPYEDSHLDEYRAMRHQLIQLLPEAEERQLRVLLETRPDLVTRSGIELPSRFKEFRDDGHGLSKNLDALLAVREALMTRIALLLQADDVGLSSLLDLAFQRGVYHLHWSTEAEVGTRVSEEVVDVCAFLRPARECLSRMNISDGSADESSVLAWLRSSHPVSLVDVLLEAIPFITPAIATMVAEYYSECNPMRLVRYLPPSFDDAPVVPHEAESAVDLHVFTKVAALEPFHETQARRERHQMTHSAQSYPLWRRFVVPTRAADLAVTASCRTDAEAAVLIEAFSSWAPNPRDRDQSLGFTKCSIFQSSGKGWLTSYGGGLGKALFRLLESQQPNIGPLVNAALRALVRRITPGDSDYLIPHGVLDQQTDLANAHQTLEYHVRASILDGLKGVRRRLSLPLQRELVWAIPLESQSFYETEILRESFTEGTLDNATRERAWTALCTGNFHMALQIQSIIAGTGRWESRFDAILAEGAEQAFEAVLANPRSVAPDTDGFYLWLTLLRHPSVSIERLHRWMREKTPLSSRKDFLVSLSANPVAVADPTLYEMLKSRRDPVILSNLLRVTPHGPRFDALVSRVVAAGPEGVGRLLDLVEVSSELLAKINRRVFAAMLQTDDRELRIRVMRLLPHRAQESAAHPAPKKASRTTR